MYPQPMRFVVAVVRLFSFLNKGAKNEDFLRHNAGKFVYLHVKQ